MRTCIIFDLISLNVASGTLLELSVPDTISCSSPVDTLELTFDQFSSLWFLVFESSNLTLEFFLNCPVLPGEDCLLFFSRSASPSDDD